MIEIQFGSYCKDGGNANISSDTVININMVVLTGMQAHRMVITQMAKDQEIAGATSELNLNFIMISVLSVYMLCMQSNVFIICPEN